MGKVYIVTTGRYSDYSIIAVFDSMELAQAFIDSNDFGSDINDIEEYELNPNKTDLAAGRKGFEIEMNKDGTTICCNMNRSYSHKPNNIYFRFNLMCLDCYADDDQHAIKIANEKRVQILALNRWGEENPLN